VQGDRESSRLGPLARDPQGHGALVAVEEDLGREAVACDDVDAGGGLLGEGEDGLQLPGHGVIDAAHVALAEQEVEALGALDEDGVVPDACGVEGVCLFEAVVRPVHDDGREPVRHVRGVPVEERQARAPAAGEVRGDVPVDADAAEVAAGHGVGHAQVLLVRPLERLAGPPVERHEQRLRREQHRRRRGAAGRRRRLSGGAAARAGPAGDHRLVVEGGEGDAAPGWLRRGGDVAHHLPRGHGRRGGREAAGVGVLRRGHRDGRPARVLRVERRRAGDVESCGRVELGPVEVGRHLVDLHLERRLGLRGGVHGLGQDGAVPAAVVDPADVGVVGPRQRQVVDDGGAVAVEHLGQVEALVVLSLGTVQAAGGVHLPRVGASHGADEFFALPPPRQLPAVEAAERRVVLERHERQVGGLVRLEHVVGDHQVARAAREEAQAPRRVGPVVVGREHAAGGEVGRRRGVGGRRARVGRVGEREKGWERFVGPGPGEERADEVDGGLCLGGVPGRGDRGEEVRLRVPGEGRGPAGVPRRGVVGQVGARGEHGAVDADEDLAVHERDLQRPGAERAGVRVDDGGSGAERVWLGVALGLGDVRPDLVAALQRVAEEDAVAAGVRRRRRRELCRGGVREEEHKEDEGQLGDGHGHGHG